MLKLSCRVFFSCIFVLLALHPQIINAQIDLTVYPEISHGSFNFPAQFSLKNNKLLFLHKSSIFHLNHPHSKYYLHSYQRENMTMVTEVSSLIYNSDYLTLELGRNFVKSGPSRYNATLFSYYTPALDQIAFNFHRIYGLDYEYRLIRLDNRQDEIGTHKRWLYYRRLSFELGTSLVVGLKDVVLATGVQRGVDLNYVNPGALFQLEQLHGHVETGTLDQNNDNQLMGFDIEWQCLSDLQVYGDFILDEFQIDAVDRERLQDVFGLTLGVQKEFSTSELSVEYFLASPWLYTNGGMYTNVEIQGVPLGLRNPHSEGVSIIYAHQLNGGYFNLQVTFQHSEDQTVSTEWNSVGNKIPIFNFNEEWETELDLSLNFEQHKYLDNIRLTYDLLSSDGLYLIIGFKLFNKQSD